MVIYTQPYCTELLPHESEPHRSVRRYLVRLTANYTDAYNFVASN